jgi:large subunit ribosomal protein L11
MAFETVDVLIEGGKATAAPPLGPALGPMGVNIGQVIQDINKKTQDFKGMQVPVKVIINTDDKSYKITVGTPPASQLIIKEAGIEKGSGNPTADLVADLKMEQIIKISKMKEDSLLGKDPIMRVKEILGTCQSMGIMVEGKKVPETLKDVDSGMFDKKIISGKTELSAEELKEQEEERIRMQKELEEKRDEFIESANGIIAANPEAERKELVNLLTEAQIPMPIINELLPEETEEGAEGKPAEGAPKPAAPAEKKE